ncbi:MAG: M43 family zinc metalloprotease [Saprospiraceae bacterium]
MRNFLIFMVALSIFSGKAVAQRSCAAEEVLAQQLLNNPEMRQIRENIQRHTEEFMQSGAVHERTVVTIPVVVHVVYYNSAQNISDAQILSQIDVLNDDFRRLNSDASNTPAGFLGVAADCEVNFCMAQQDPNGNATNGIVRKSTTVNGFSTNDNVKFNSSGGSNIWDRNKYLNIWVCNLSGGLLGYAQFPGGPASTDGVVCDYAYFGTINSTPPFHLGRTATHEVGHWLNCYHIWGDDGSSCSGSDLVSDTPNQADENYGCPSFPTISCSNGPNGDMFMNYMDYTDDACMNVFTTGQKSRMQSLFSPGGARNALLSSPGCQPGGGGGCDTPGGLSASSITQSSATLSWSAVSGASSYTLQWEEAGSNNWTTVSNISGTSYNLSGLSAGTDYNFHVKTVCSGDESNYSSDYGFTTSGGGGGCQDQYEPNNTRNSAPVISTGVSFTAQIAAAGDNDWYRFSNTSSQRKIKIDLTTLPADYDLRLYENNKLRAISQNGGTLDEQIIYNTNKVSSSYYAYVYGYNGANSNTECYTLLVSLKSTNWRTDGSVDGPVTELEIPVQFENAGFGLFPNPAADILTVEVPMQNEGDVSVSILDPSGKSTMTQQLSLGKDHNRINFDIQTLPNGVYFVQVRSEEMTKIRKFVIQH